MIKVAKLGDIWVGPRPQGDPRELIGHQGGTKAGWYTNYANNSAYTYGIYGFHDYIMYHDVFISARCLDTQHFCFFTQDTHQKKCMHTYEDIRIPTIKMFGRWVVDSAWHWGSILPKSMGTVNHGKLWCQGLNGWTAIFAGGRWWKPLQFHFCCLELGIDMAKSHYAGF